MAGNSLPTSSQPGQLGNLLAEWRQSWRPGVAAIIGGSLGYSLWSAVSSLFVVPLQTEFGWSRGDIAAANYVGLFTAFVAPFLGRLVDRIDAKPVLMGGLILVSICYVALSQIRADIAYFYALYFLLMLFGLATTGITVTRIIAGNFDKSRGSSLAFARSALGISAALTPLLLSPAIMRFGSTGGFLVMAGFACCVALPMVYFLVPDRKNAGSLNVAFPQLNANRWQALLTQPKVRILCVAAALNYAPVAAIISQVQPIGISKGLSPVVAAGGIAALGGAAALGALLSGFLVDRFWAPAVAFAFNILPAGGCIALALMGGDISPTAFYATVFLVGIGQGAEIDVVAFMIARYFGLASYSTIYGLSVLFIAISSAVSASLIGRAYDVFGDYNEAILGAAASFALASIAYLAMGRYPNTPATETIAGH